MFLGFGEGRLCVFGFLFFNAILVSTKVNCVWRLFWFRRFLMESCLREEEFLEFGFGVSRVWVV